MCSRHLASICAIVAVTVAVARTARAEPLVVSIPSARDTTLFSEKGSLSNGAGSSMFTGVTAKMAREVIKHLAQPQIRASMNDEMIYQTFISKSDDMAEMRAARAEERPPKYTGS